MIRTKELRDAVAATPLEDITAADIMNTNVMTIGYDWPVSYLAEFLTEHSISGGPVVADDGQLLGVVSVTDIVRYDSFPEREPRKEVPPIYYHHALEDLYSPEDLASFRFANDDETRVQDIMTPMLFAVPEDASLRNIAKTMITGRIHRVLVTKGDELVGIISALDVIRLLANDY